jgi:broad specificity phosphatase PhoE
MTNLVLVRHGESVWHAENRYTGRSDIALTEQGQHEAELLGHWASVTQLDAIWISDLARTYDTAVPSARATGLQPYIDTRLRELDFGDGEGHTKAELRKLFPNAWKAFLDNPADHPLPGGEDPYKAAERAVSCFRDIVQTYPEGKVLVVFHSTLLRLSLCKLLGIPLRNYRTTFSFVRNCALTEIKIQDDKTSLVMFNSPIEAHAALAQAHSNTTNAIF